MIHNLQKQTIDKEFTRTFLTYTGAFLFAVIMTILVHEFGHYLSLLWRGYSSLVLYINPFMGFTSSTQEIQLQDAIYICMGGTSFNLTLASILGILLHKRKSSSWIILKMYPATAFLIEGMVIFAGLFYKEPITDFAMLVELGWNPILVGSLGVLFLVIGGLGTYEIWTLLGIKPDHSRGYLLLLNGPFILYFLAGVLISQQLLPMEMDFIKGFLTLTMFLHWLYLGIRILLAPQFLSLFRIRLAGDDPQLSKLTSRFSLIVGSAAWVLSLLVLN